MQIDAKNLVNYDLEQELDRLRQVKNILEEAEKLGVTVKWDIIPTDQEIRDMLTIQTPLLQEKYNTTDWLGVLNKIALNELDTPALQGTKRTFERIVSPVDRVLTKQNGVSDSPLVNFLRLCELHRNTDYKLAEQLSPVYSHHLNSYLFKYGPKSGHDPKDWKHRLEAYGVDKETKLHKYSKQTAHVLSVLQPLFLGTQYKPITPLSLEEADSLARESNTRPAGGALIGRNGKDPQVREEVLAVARQIIENPFVHGVIPKYPQDRTQHKGVVGILNIMDELGISYSEFITRQELQHKVISLVSEKYGNFVTFLPNSPLDIHPLERIVPLPFSIEERKALVEKGYPKFILNKVKNTTLDNFVVNYALISPNIFAEIEKKVMTDYDLEFKLSHFTSFKKRIVFAESLPVTRVAQTIMRPVMDHISSVTYAGQPVFGSLQDTPTTKKKVSYIIDRIAENSDKFSISGTDKSAFDNFISNQVTLLMAATVIGPLLPEDKISLGKWLIINTMFPRMLTPYGLYSFANITASGELLTALKNSFLSKLASYLVPIVAKNAEPREYLSQLKDLNLLNANDVLGDDEITAVPSDLVDEIGLTDQYTATASDLLGIDIHPVKSLASKSQRGGEYLRQNYYPMYSYKKEFYSSSQAVAHMMVGADFFEQTSKNTSLINMVGDYMRLDNVSYHPYINVILPWFVGKDKFKLGTKPFRYLTNYNRKLWEEQTGGDPDQVAKYEVLINSPTEVIKYASKEAEHIQTTLGRAIGESYKEELRKQSVTDIIDSLRSLQLLHAFGTDQEKYKSLIEEIQQV